MRSFGVHAALVLRTSDPEAKGAFGGMDAAANACRIAVTAPYPPRLRSVRRFFPCRPGDRAEGRLIFAGLSRSPSGRSDRRRDGSFGESRRDVSGVERISAGDNDQSFAIPPFRCIAQGGCLRCRDCYGGSRRFGAQPAIVAASAPVSRCPHVRMPDGAPLARLPPFGDARRQGMNSVGAEH
jgi:hypothetical protein